MLIQSNPLPEIARACALLKNYVMGAIHTNTYEGFGAA